MKCPIDGTPLVMTDRSGVEIDYCPQCRGVWLDRGELDKIIDRSAAAPQQPAYAPQPQHRPAEPSYAPEFYGDKHYKKKKRESFLGDLFDF